jgi:hypothetical protein
MFVLLIELMICADEMGSGGMIIHTRFNDD